MVTRDLRLTSVDDPTLSLELWNVQDLDVFMVAFTEAKADLVDKFWWASQVSEVSTLNWLRSRDRARLDGSEYAFKILVTDPSTGHVTVAGHVSIGWLDWTHRRATLGFWLRPSARGQHLCTPVLRTVAAFAFSTLGLGRIEITTAVGNRTARTCFLNAGATFEGVACNRFLLAGVFTDGAVFSLTPQVLAALNAPPDSPSTRVFAG